MSARGFGGIVRSAAQPPPAAPATVTGADNGLSLSGTDVVLGGILINDTDIDINASHLYINEGILRLIELDPGAGRYLFGILDTGTNISNAISFENDTAIIYAGTLGEALKITQSGTLYEFGDLLGGGNGLRLEIDDGAIRAELFTPAGRLFSLDQLIGEYQFGDSDGVGNLNYFEVDDANSNTWVNSGSGRRLELDTGNQLYRMGDIGNTGNNNKMAIDDANNLFYFQSGGGRRLNLDAGNNLYQFGDIDVQNNGAAISIDDFANVISLDNSASNVGISINGVAGFSGTVAAPASITVDGGIVTNVT